MTEKFSRSTPILPTPSCDLFELTAQLGEGWGISCGERLVQYLAWSDATGIFSLLAERGPTTLNGICAGTILNEVGADALVSILASVGLAHRTRGGLYSLSEMGLAYFVKSSPYYAGPGMFLDCDKELPNAYRREPVNSSEEASTPRWPTPLRLRVQHSRNFAPAVVAARTGEFTTVKHLVDVAGGSGVLAIPLALDRPDIRITLVETPGTIADVRDFLTQYGVEERVCLLGMDVFRDDWNFAACDGMFFGNFFHAVDDASCRILAKKSFDSLERGGKIWLHEILFNENRDGPLIAALWNANMVVRRKGARQHTASKLVEILQAAGFVDCYERPTAGGFSLVAGKKPS
jgi:3-hydroxy-5-methyl-1-naphthoate 3-O-methyltransferase